MPATVPGDTVATSHADVPRDALRAKATPFCELVDPLVTKVAPLAAPPVPN